MSVKYSDRPDLPRVVLAALTDPYYEEGLNEHEEQLDEKTRLLFRGNSFSATTLPRSARQRELFARHSHRVTVDPLAAFWKMFGHTIHAILEKHGDAGSMVEQRLGTIVKIGRGPGRREVYVHGAADIYTRDEVIEDYKITTVLTMKFGTRKEYEAQLNTLAYIWRRNGHPVRAIRNIYLFRDWKGREVRDDPDHWYPKEQVVTREVEMWSDAEVEKYILERVEAHMKAKNQPDDEIAFCTDEERWMKEPTFKIYKIDPKTGLSQPKAKAILESESEASAWVINPDNAFERRKGPDKKNLPEPDPLKPIKYEIREIKASPTRCEFCEIAQFCNQRREELALMEGQPEGEEEDGG